MYALWDALADGRPSSFCTAQARVFLGAVAVVRCLQGCLGACWFFSWTGKAGASSLAGVLLRSRRSQQSTAPPGLFHSFPPRAPARGPPAGPTAAATPCPGSLLPRSAKDPRPIRRLDY